MWVVAAIYGQHAGYIWTTCRLYMDNMQVYLDAIDFMSIIRHNAGIHGHK